MWQSQGMSCEIKLVLLCGEFDEKYKEKKQSE